MNKIKNLTLDPNNKNYVIADGGIYSKDYKNSQFPLVLSQCLMVPIKNLTFNKIYEINLETNKNFSQRFCLKRNENKTELIIINDGRQKCEV